MLRLSKLLTALPVGATLVALSAGAGCSTRTVYVVDDRRPAPVVVERAPERVVVESSGAPSSGGGGSGIVAYESDVGIVDDSDFYEPLSPYGTWIAYPGYGMVWQPSVTVVGRSFRPYTHGHWEHTEWGWTWVDHHPFGWATGHYGRWLYDSSYGWVWTPGTVWSPAWVTWRTGGGYIGWAAMPPGSVYGGSYSVYDTSWVFVSSGNLGVAYVGGVIVTGAAYRTCYYETRDYRSTYVVYGREYYRGPDYDEVRHQGRVIHRPLAETERERPVSRPPSGTVIARGRDRGRDPTTRGRDRDGSDDRGTGRDRDGSDDRGTGRPRDGADDNRDNGRGGGRDGGSNGNAGNDNNGRGRDRDGNTGNGDNGRGRDRDNGVDQPRDNDGYGRDRDNDGRENNGRDNGKGNGRGNDDVVVEDPRGNGYDGRGSVRPESDGRATPIKDATVDVGRGNPRDRDPVSGNDRDGNDNGRDGNDNGRGNVGGTDRDDVVTYPTRPGRSPVVNEDVRVPPRTTPDRSPVRGGPVVEAPKKTYVDDPDRFRDSTRVGGRPVSVPDRGPSVDRTPTVDRTPSVDRGRAPSRGTVDRAPAKQPEPEQQPTTSSTKKKKAAEPAKKTTTKKR